MKNEILERMNTNPDICFGKPAFSIKQFIFDPIVDKPQAQYLVNIKSALLFTNLKSVHKIIA